MEFSIYFSVCVICIGTLHLIYQLAASVHSSQPHASATLQTTQRAMRLRDDWYMFFYCSTLIQQGPASYNNHTAAKHQDSVASSYQKRNPSRLTVRTYVH